MKLKTKTMMSNRNNWL